jgi:diacylglycerol O-acyltransferase-1
LLARSLLLLVQLANVFFTMSTATSTATSLSPSKGDSNGVAKRSGPTAADDDALTHTQQQEKDAAEATEALRKSFRQKYRHVEAIHSQSKPSCLSHDTTESPSFLGFRNLMVIMLGESSLSLITHGPN